MSRGARIEWSRKASEVVVYTDVGTAHIGWRSGWLTYEQADPIDLPFLECIARKAQPQVYAHGQIVLGLELVEEP